MLTVVVCEKDGSTIIDAPGDLLSVSGLEELDGQGGGSFTISRSNPSLTAHPTLLARRNVVKIYDRGVAVAAFVIRKVANVVVGSDLIDAVTVSGPGLLSWLEDAVVYQQYQTAYARDRRWFNWGSQEGSWYNAAEWGAAVVGREIYTDDVIPTNPRRFHPKNWPTSVIPTSWIWDRNDDVGAPLGEVYFRRPFVTSSNGTAYRLFFTCDNLATVEIDGAPIAVLDDQWSWLQTYVVDVVLNEGTHVLAFKCRNLHGPAGLAAMLCENDEEDLSPVSVTGGGSWLMNAYPDSEPGWTFGEVISVMIGEAAGRGVANYSTMARDFTDVADSGSNAWTVFPVVASVGATYWDTFYSWKDYGLDLAFDAETLTLSAYNNRGTIRTGVVVDAGAHIVSADESTEWAGFNTLLISTGEQWAGASDPDSVAEHGRVESYLDVSSISAREAVSVAQATLDKADIEATSVTVQWEPVAGNVPWRDFTVGDVITVSSVAGYEQRRVHSIAASMDDTSTAYAVELGTRNLAEIERLQSLIDRITSSQVSSATPYEPAGRYEDAKFSPSGGVDEYEWPGEGDADAFTWDDTLGNGWFNWARPAIVKDQTNAGTDSGVGYLDYYTARNILDNYSYKSVGDIRVLLLTDVPTLGNDDTDWDTGEYDHDQVLSMELSAGGYRQDKILDSEIVANDFDRQAVGYGDDDWSDYRLTVERWLSFGVNTTLSDWPLVRAVAMVDVNGRVIYVHALAAPVAVKSMAEAVIGESVGNGLDPDYVWGPDMRVVHGSTWYLDFYSALDVSYPPNLSLEFASSMAQAFADESSTVQIALRSLFVGDVDAVVDGYTYRIGWSTSTTWELGSNSFPAPGYTRGTATVPSTGSNPELSTGVVSFGTNTGTADWPEITHATVIKSSGVVMSAVQFDAPVVVKPGESLIIYPGDLTFEVVVK